MLRFPASDQLCPDYLGVELGLGEAILVKAIAQCTGRLPAKIKADYKDEGDLGLVAMSSRKSQPTLWKPKPLTVPYVFNKLSEIAKISGASVRPWNAQRYRPRTSSNLSLVCRSVVANAQDWDHQPAVCRLGGRGGKVPDPKFGGQAANQAGGKIGRRRAGKRGRALEKR